MHSSVAHVAEQKTWTYNCVISHTEEKAYYIIEQRRDRINVIVTFHIMDNSYYAT